MIWWLCVNLKGFAQSAVTVGKGGVTLSRLMIFKIMKILEVIN